MRGHKGFVAGLLVLAMMVLAACSGSQPAPQPNQSQAQKQSQPASQKKVEIFSWWSSGGDAKALQALFDLHAKAYPGVEIINAAVSGGAGTNAKAVLVSRMTANDPPDTFQVHAGHELLDSWVLAGKMEPLNDLYQSEGWNDKFPKKLIEDMSQNGQVYSVAVNIHRSNVLWYNKKVFADSNLKPPATMAEFFQVADALKAKGIIPYVQGDKEPWTAVHLFESILLGTMGPDAYNELFTGKRKWDDPGVKQALENYKRLATYFNTDHAGRTFQEALQLLVEGKGAMHIMGDWTKGYLATLGLKPDVEYGFAPAPGTQGSFLWLSDSFGLPKGVKNRAEVINFLKSLGSEQGQETFNLLKGSIPARLNVDKSKYDVYGQWAMNAWAKDKLAPSIAHGAAASQGFMDKIVDVFSVFTTSGNVDQAWKGLQDAAKELKF